MSKGFVAEFDIFFDLAGGSFGSLNNLVGTGVNVYCDNQFRATILSH